MVEVITSDSVTVIGEGDDSGETRRRRGRRRGRQFDIRDFDTIAQDIVDEWSRRKNARKDLEAQWAEIDRQVAMEPDTAFKRLPNGKVDTRKMWMSEMELPLQAQALEVLTADARRFEFPKGEKWFAAHAELTDDYLQRADFQSFILGDQLEVPSRITQDNADKLIEGYLSWHMRQYDFRTHMDRCNADAFKYGMGIGRVRVQEKNVFIHESKGTRREKKKIPVLQPVCIKNLYLDDPLPSMYSAQVLGDAHIAEDNIKLANLQIAAAKGSSDPNDPDGGWMPDNVKKLRTDADGYVKVLELEGDLIVGRKTVRDVVLPAVIVTVAVAADKNGGESKQVIRFRFRQYPFSSYILFPYHYEGADQIYPTSPLMKGRPIQIMATDALNRLMDSAALKNSPPVGYDRSSMAYAAEGGPEIHPYAQWETMEAVKVYTEIGGEQSAMLATFQAGVSLYSELTGVLPARLGAQTRSHTTAFAKGAELERGAVRTVDYTDASGDGPLERWLDAQYQIGRDILGNNEKISFYIDSYGGFVEITKAALPEKATFEWFGATGPAEIAARRQSKMNSLQMAVQIDQLNMQAQAARGEVPTPIVDLGAAVQQVLRDGNWTDLDAITRIENVAGGTSPASPMAAVDGSAGGDGTAIAALQALSGGLA